MYSLYPEERVCQWEEKRGNEEKQNARAFNEDLLLIGVKEDDYQYIYRRHNGKAGISAVKCLFYQIFNFHQILSFR